MTARDTLIAEEEFESEWRPSTSESGDLLTFEEVVNSPRNHVWTIIESGEQEDRNWYASPGFHTVNKLGYVLTNKPWSDDTPDAIYFLDDLDRDP